MPKDRRQPLPESSEEVVRRFHSLYYDTGAWKDNSWFGEPTRKCPLDLWIYQEILNRTRPDVIVECGTGWGGTAYFLACMCDIVGSGRILTIDVREIPNRPRQPRIEYLTGSSLAPDVLAEVRDSIRPDERVTVILDSDHSRDHVLGELRAYSPMVSEGNYLIVEDTNINGHPILPETGPGPMEAVEEFLRETSSFVVDRSCEKSLMTFNPGGFLLRVKEQG